MNSNYYKNEINNNDDSQRFQRIRSDWFHKTQQPAIPALYEQTVTTTTKTVLNNESNAKSDEMTTTHLEKSPIRRVNLVHGPQSAFARLFPDKYRQQEQDECRTKHRSKSSDSQRYNFDRIKDQQISSDEEDEVITKYRRVSFYDSPKNDFLSDQNRLKTHTKSEPYLTETKDYYSNILSTKASDERLAHMPLNYDPEPEIIYRDNPEKVVYVQKVGVRYLKPPTPPPPGPIVIREVQPTQPKQPPPLVISNTPPIPPRTPSPLIVREQPPTPPQHIPARVITKTLPVPPALPRRVIIKRIPPLPAKPRPVIIEKWLPYKTPPNRPILYERAEQSDQTRSAQHNVILQYEPARVRIEQEIQNAGCFRVDPNIYRAQFGTSLRRTDSIRQVLQNIGCNPDILTSTGYNTTCPSSQNTNSSQYNSPQQIPQQTSTTCFTDEQLSELLNGSAANNQRYNIPSTSRTNNQVYYTHVPDN